MPVKDNLIKDLNKLFVAAILVKELGRTDNASYNIGTGVTVVDHMVEPYESSVRIGSTTQSDIVKSVKERIETVKEIGNNLFTIDILGNISPNGIIGYRNLGSEYQSSKKNRYNFYEFSHTDTPLNKIDEYAYLDSNIVIIKNVSTMAVKDQVTVKNSYILSYRLRRSVRR